MKMNKVLVVLVVSLVPLVCFGAAGDVHYVNTGVGDQMLKVSGGKQEVLDAITAAQVKADRIKATIALPTSEVMVDAEAAANKLETEIVKEAEVKAAQMIAADPSPAGKTKANKLIEDAKKIAKEEAGKLLTQAIDAAKKIGTQVVNDTLVVGKDAMKMVISNPKGALDLIKNKAGSIANNAFSTAKGEVATIAKGLLDKAKGLLSKLF